MDNPIIAQVILQMFILLLTAKILGVICNKATCPQVVGEFLAGLIWSPSLIQWAFPSLYNLVFPSEMNSMDLTIMGLVTLLGFLSMLALSGSEISIITKKIRNLVIFHSFGTICLAFIGGYILILITPEVLINNSIPLFDIGFFLSICLAMSAVPIISRVLNDWGMLASHNGQFLMLASTLVDFLGWILLSIGIALVTVNHNDILIIPLLGNICRMIIGLVILIIAGYFLMKAMNRLDIDYGFWPLFLGFSVYTHFVAKINLYIGGLLFGIIASSIPRYRKQLQLGLNGFTTEVFTPLFFAMVGHHGNVLIFSDINIVIYTVEFLLVGVLVKIIPSFFLKKKNTSWRETWMVSLCLNARGGMEIFVAVTGIALGIFNNAMYTVLVTTAILTAISCPLVLRWYMLKPSKEDIKTYSDLKADTHLLE